MGTQLLLLKETLFGKIMRLGEDGAANTEKEPNVSLLFY